jgi:acetyl esterase/lipase
MKSRLAALLVIVPVALWCGILSAAQPPADVRFEADIVYGKAGGEDLKLNLSRPANAQGALPCVIVIHGGAWRAGDRSVHNDLTWKFAQRGYVSATLGYRFCPKFIFPAQVEDVKCAVRFLRANAQKYGIDPDHLGAVGFSAGAHLSMMLGVMDKEDGLDDSGGSSGHSSKVNAVVSFFGPTDMLSEYPDASKNLLRDFIGGTRAEKEDAYRKASPITYISKGDAPILLLQGTADPLVPDTQAMLMIQAMGKAGVPGRAEIIAGGSHGWGGKDLERTIQEMYTFFDENLRPATTAQKQGSR